jgi:hypothetical protein
VDVYIHFPIRLHGGTGTTLLLLEVLDTSKLDVSRGARASVAGLFASGSFLEAADGTAEERNSFLKCLGFRSREPAFVSKSTAMNFEASSPLPPVCTYTWLS